MVYFEKTKWWIQYDGHEKNKKYWIEKIGIKGYLRSLMLFLEEQNGGSIMADMKRKKY